MAGFRRQLSISCSHWQTRWNLKETHDDRACGSGNVCFEMTMLLLMSTKKTFLFQHQQPTKPFSFLSNSFMPRLELRGVHKTFGTIYEGPRTRVDQPKTKYWKLHELCKNAIKNIHTIWACGQKFQIPTCSAASEMHFMVHCIYWEMVKESGKEGNLTLHIVIVLWMYSQHDIFKYELCNWGEPERAPH